MNLISLRGGATMKNHLLTARMVREALEYDPATGTLTWKVRPRSHFVDCRSQAIWNARYPGKIAGGGRAKGYPVIGLCDRKWTAHRIIWLLVHGEWPRVIDHINGNREDNRIENLRSVSTSENARNRRLSTANSSGMHGVFWHDREQRWYARISVDRKLIHLGSFKSKEEAMTVRAKAEREHGFHPNHGKAA